MSAGHARRGAQRCDAWRGILAHDMQADIAEPLPHQRKNLAGKPDDGIHIRQMRKAAEEQNIAPAARTSPAPRDVTRHRNRADNRAGTLVSENIRFIAADHDGRIRHVHEGKLLRLAHRRRRGNRRRILDHRLPSFAQEVEVDRPEDHASRGTTTPNDGKAPLRREMAAQDDEVVVVGQARQGQIGRGEMRRAKPVDAHRFESVRVARQASAARGGQEADAKTQVAQETQQIEGAERAEILVGRGAGGLDDQGSPMRRPALPSWWIWQDFPPTCRCREYIAGKSGWSRPGAGHVPTSNGSESGSERCYLRQRPPRGPIELPRHRTHDPRGFGPKSFSKEISLCSARRISTTAWPPQSSFRK